MVEGQYVFFMIGEVYFRNGPCWGLGLFIFHQLKNCFAMNKLYLLVICGRQGKYWRSIGHGS